MNPALSEFLDWRKHGFADAKALGECLRALVDEGLDDLPPPGGGRTLERWQALACVAGHDLGLCKLYEGHTDALAIMTELGAPPSERGSTWGMWAAEPPQARVSIAGKVAGANGKHQDTRRVQLRGRKAWCSGAAALSHALITTWDAHNRQQLVAVALDQPGVTVTTDGWRAVGMGATGSVEVQFDGAHGQLIGAPGDYLARPVSGKAASASPLVGTARPVAWRNIWPCNSNNVRSRTPWRIWVRSTQRCTVPRACCATAQAAWIRRPLPTRSGWRGAVAP